MIVNFKSIIKRDGQEDEKIKFSAPVNFINNNGLKTWEFKEPSRGIMNLIEVFDDKVNIFAGTQTIQLKLKTKIFNHYYQEGMPTPIQFDSFLNTIDLNNNDDDLLIKYTLWQGQQIIGDYTMTLEIK